MKKLSVEEKKSLETSIIFCNKNLNDIKSRKATEEMQWLHSIITDLYIYYGDEFYNVYLNSCRLAMNYEGFKEEFPCESYYDGIRKDD